MPMPKHLNGAGMGFFLDNYEYLAARPERNAAINHFVNSGRCNEGGAERRFINAKALFEDKQLLRETLEYIAWKAPKANVAQRAKAKVLLMGLG